MSRYLDYLYILDTIGFTEYGQLILKWRIAKIGPLPVESAEKLKFLFGLLFDPAILTSAWMSIS